MIVANCGTLLAEHDAPEFEEQSEKSPRYVRRAVPESLEDPACVAKSEASGAGMVDFDGRAECAGDLSLRCPKKYMLSPG